MYLLILSLNNLITFPPSPGNLSAPHLKESLYITSWFLCSLFWIRKVCSSSNTKCTLKSHHFILWLETIPRLYLIHRMKSKVLRSLPYLQLWHSRPLPQAFTADTYLFINHLYWVASTSLCQNFSVLFTTLISGLGEGLAHSSNWINICQSYEWNQTILIYLITKQLQIAYIF